MNNKLKWQAINKAFATKKYWYIITTVDNNVPKLICAENIVIDPTNVIIEWVGSPYVDTRMLLDEGLL